MSPEEQRQAQENNEFFNARLQELQESYRKLNARMEALAAGRGVDWNSLPTQQEDSSQNDA